MIKPEFTVGDMHNPLFAKFQDYFAWRLEKLRMDNDKDLDERKTAEIRGRIAEFKALMMIGKIPDTEE